MIGSLDKHYKVKSPSPFVWCKKLFDVSISPRVVSEAMLNNDINLS